MHIQKVRRSRLKRMTREAVVLRVLRRFKRITMSQAGAMIGVSSSAISHCEQVRMNLPRARIPELLAGYGYTTAEFDELVAGRPLPVIDLRDECEQIVNQIDASKLKALHAVLMSFLT